MFAFCHTINSISNPRILNRLLLSSLLSFSGFSQTFGRSPDSLKAWLGRAIHLYENGNYPESARYERKCIVDNFTLLSKSTCSMK